MSSEHTPAERNQLLSHLMRLGFLGQEAKLEDVLNLTTDDVPTEKITNYGTSERFS